MLYSDLIKKVSEGDFRSLARCISIVENDLEGSQEILKNLSINESPVIGITGPPGAGKSTLVNTLISHYTKEGKKIGVIAIDPTSPFNYGSILGDRIRMSEHFNNPNVYIRSLATRGSLGGLSAKTVEITDVMRSANFDMIIVETVGVGQSEVEIVGLADTTVLVLVPEAGDEVQSIKSGIMEIADIFVVNKSDRPGADLYHKNLVQLIHEQPLKKWTAKAVKAIATKNEGIEEISAYINEHNKIAHNEKKPYLLTEKAYKLIQEYKMKNVDKQDLLSGINQSLKQANFNLYKFVEDYLSKR
jgi:LAO/AO transport system kinase